MKRILDGVRRFQQGAFEERRKLFGRLANGQEPQALFLTCSDSRVDPNLITQSQPGDLFICRNAGNIVPPHSGETGAMTASIEFAVMALEVPDAIVCGHTDCGAMKGALNPEGLGHLPHVANWLTFAEAAVRVVEELQPEGDDDGRLLSVTEQNVLLQLQHLRTHPCVAAKTASGALNLHGWVYNIESGEITVYDPIKRQFVPLGGASPKGERIRVHPL